MHECNITIYRCTIITCFIAHDHVSESLCGIVIFTHLQSLVNYNKVMNIYYDKEKLDESNHNCSHLQNFKEFCNYNQSNNNIQVWTPG